MKRRHILLICVGLIRCSLVPAINAQTLTLDSCLQIAQRNNYEIKSSQLEIKKAQAVKRQVYTKYFPQINAYGTGYYASDPLIRYGIADIQSEDVRLLMEDLYEVLSDGTDINDEITLMKKGMGASLVAIQPIYTGGRIWNGNKLANLGVEASQMQFEMKRRDALEAVESSFYLVVGLQEKEATVLAALSLIDSLHHTVVLALDNGLVTRSDLLQVELKRNEMLANQQQLTSGIRLAKRLLCKQIGIEYSEELRFVDSNTSPNNDPILKSQNAILNSQYPNRPEKQLLQLNVEAEKLKKKLTRGETMPQVALIGSAFYGNLITNNPSSNGVALLSLTIPFSAWWETSHKMQQHNIAIEQALQQQNHLNEMMSLEVEKAHSDMVDAWMLLKSDSTALELARENYRLATLNYTAGTVTLTDVLMAHTLLLQASNTLTDRRITYIVARRRLKDITEQ